MKKTNIEKAKADLKNTGINSIHTIVVKTNVGNYNYFHIANENSKNPSRFFDPKTGKDLPCASENHVNGYLINIIKLQPVVIEGYFTGADVKQEYEAIKSGKGLYELPPINLVKL